MKEKKKYCANCSHCIVFKKPIAKGRYYVLRVRCDMGMWKKRLSKEEKIYKYYTLLKRTVDNCLYYDPMGEEESFIKDLKKTLPVQDIVYAYESI